jgi:O-methyltransferase
MTYSCEWGRHTGVRHTYHSLNGDRLVQTQKVITHTVVPSSRRVLRAVYHGLRSWNETRSAESSLKIARPLTMVSDPSLVNLARIVRHVIDEEIQGDFVECGVWRGGASFLMADMLRKSQLNDRKVWMFDSFAGLPAPSEADGALASQFLEKKDSVETHYNNTASLEEVTASANALGLTNYVHLVKGWFEDTLPVHHETIGPIALLRIDGDWYESVRCCLDTLYDQVSDKGFVILDDYYHWPGCALAVHDFLSERRLSHRIESVAGGQSAFFRKVNSDRPFVSTFEWGRSEQKRRY